MSSLRTSLQRVFSHNQRQLRKFSPWIFHHRHFRRRRRHSFLPSPHHSRRRVTHLQPCPCDHAPPSNSDGVQCPGWFERRTTLRQHPRAIPRRSSSSSSSLRITGRCHQTRSHRHRRRQPRRPNSSDETLMPGTQLLRTTTITTPSMMTPPPPPLLPSTKPAKIILGVSTGRKTGAVVTSVPFPQKVSIALQIIYWLNMAIASAVCPR